MRKALALLEKEAQENAMTTGGGGGGSTKTIVTSMRP